MENFCKVFVSLSAPMPTGTEWEEQAGEQGRAEADVTAKIEWILIYLDSPDIPVCPKDVVTDGLDGTLQQVLNLGSQPREAAHVPPLGETPCPPQNAGHWSVGPNSPRGEEQRGNEWGDKEGPGAPKLEESEEQRYAEVTHEGWA